MLASYGVILKRSAMITALAALVAVLASSLAAGTKGLTGSSLGVALVAVFFGVSALVMIWVNRRKPQVVMAAAMAVYLIKIVVLLVLVAKFSTTTAFNGKAFGLTVVACTVVWVSAQALTSARLKVPYVEPDGER